MTDLKHTIHKQKKLSATTSGNGTDSVLVYLHLFFCLLFFPNETDFVISCLLPWAANFFQKGPTLKRKNLLLLEQILSFNS